MSVPTSPRPVVIKSNSFLVRDKQWIAECKNSGRKNNKQKSNKQASGWKASPMEIWSEAASFGDETKREKRRRVIHTEYQQEISILDSHRKCFSYI
jgi:hypothetical protein